MPALSPPPLRALRLSPCLPPPQRGQGCSMPRLPSQCHPGDGGGRGGDDTTPGMLPPSSGLQQAAPSPPRSHQDGPSAPGGAAGLHPLAFPPRDWWQTGAAVGAGDKLLHGPAKRRGKKNDPGESRDGLCISSGSPGDARWSLLRGPGTCRLPEPPSAEREVMAAMAQ